MKPYMQTDTWINYTLIVLGSIMILSVSGIVLLIIIQHSISEILAALGIIAGAGLAKLFISPLHRRLFE